MSNEELVERIRNGDHVTEHMQELYENNLPLIRQFIKPYTNYAEEQDLLQETYFGLHEAVWRYEPSKGVLFMTYAQYWIQHKIRQYIEHNGSVIRIPTAHRQKIARYQKTVQEFEKTYGRLPTDEEAAEYSMLPIADIQTAKFYMQEVISLDAPLKSDDEWSLADTVADKRSLENDTVDKIYVEYQKSELWAIVEKYTDKKQEQVIRQYYKEGKTLAQIARDTGMGLDETKQYKEKGLQRLRTGKAGRELREKLEIAEASAYRSGFRRFKEHGDSVVERIAIRQVELEERYKNIVLREQ